MDSEVSGRIARIESCLARLPSLGSICVLPDFFIDRFVRIQNLDELFAAIKRKSVEGGGGSIHGVNQTDVKGGNAVNVAYALGKLGSSVELFAIANSVAADMLRASFRNIRSVNLNVIDGRPGFTIALEFAEHGRHVNVMLSDVGDLEGFDGSEFSESHWDSLAKSKIVCVVNWASNKKGNHLCRATFSHAKKKGLLTFFDPADLSELSYLLPEFKRKILDEYLLDCLSINDNEARIMCNSLTNFNLPQNFSEDDLRQAAKKLSEIANATIDLHTRRISFSCTGKDCTSVPCYKLEQRTVTGAGDVWDASDLIGHLTGMKTEDRVAFANATAGLYVSREKAEPPTLEEVFQFMREKKTY